MESKYNKVNKISIIVPVYNAEKKIEKCLKSLIRQTYKEIEIIIINDGSTDNSLKICQAYSQKDNRIKVITKKNGGVSSARNTGIMEATGRYIAFVDSDDYVDIDMCKKMRDAMIITNSDLVIASYFTIYNNKIKKHECPNRTYNSIEEMKDDFEVIYLDCFINSPWNKLFKRDKIKELFNEEMHYFEDYYFNLSYMEEIKKIVTINEAFYYYKEDSLMSLTKLYRENIFDVFPIIYMKQLEFSNKHFGNTFDVLIKDSLIYGLYNSIQKLIYSDNTKKYKFQIMRKWRDEESVKLVLCDEDLNEYWKKKSLQYKIGYKLIKLKKFNFIYYLFCIKKLCFYFLNSIGGKNANNK